MNEIFEPGTIVTWKSQAGGYTKVKTGKVIAIIPKNQDGYHQIPGFNDYYKQNSISYRRIKGQRCSQIVRYLVEVPRGGRSVLCDYYFPNFSLVKKVEVKEQTCN
jgi:hypothetical protein